METHYLGNEYSSERRKSFNTLIILTLILLAIVVLFIGLNQQGKKHAEQARKAEIRTHIKNYLPVTFNKYDVNPLGGIKNLKFNVKNNSDYAVDDASLEVSYIKANGQIYQKELIHLGRIPAHSETTKMAPQSDRGVKIKYHMSSIKSSDLDL